MAAEVYKNDKESVKKLSRMIRLSCADDDINDKFGLIYHGFEFLLYWYITIIVIILLTFYFDWIALRMCFGGKRRRISQALGNCCVYVGKKLGTCIVSCS